MLSIIFLLLVLSVVNASPAPRELTEQEKVTHVLNRLAFGPRPGDVDRVQSMGIRQYIEQQLHPEQINDSAADTRLSQLPSIHMKMDDLMDKYPEPQQIAQRSGIRNPKAGDKDAAQDRARLQEYMRVNGLERPQQLLQELESQKIIRGVYSERQLQEVMTDFWFNHFNVYWNKGQDKWFTTDYEINVIRPRALGKFRDLLMATAKSPAMLFYLDNHLSTTPNMVAPLSAVTAARLANPNAPLSPTIQAAAAKQGKGKRAGINENYGRELMELHTMGVDGGYTQKDVTEVARALTGWTIDRPRDGARFIFRPAMHDRGEKIVLGQKIRAGGGIEDGEKVIDILAHQPSTAHFIATKLVRYFVNDNPPEPLIEKVAATYMKSDGDIREMLRTIFYSGEFMSADAYGQKTKSAFGYVVSAIRAVNGETDGNPRLAQLLGKMGQPIYQFVAPTGFPDRTDYWISDGSLIERINFAVNLTSNKIPNTRVQLTSFPDPKAAALYLGSPEFQKR
ncbi:MAG TPA: DUF1800 domain-containing protein [Terriglobia bacterium]|nr:DUF1800 domain-containing protein [Terriglobia bacterium]